MTTATIERVEEATTDFKQAVVEAAADNNLIYIEPEEKLFTSEGDPPNVMISSQFEIDQLDQFISQLQFFDRNDRVIEDSESEKGAISNFIARHGGFVGRDLLGYTAHSVDGKRDFDSNDENNFAYGGVVFGRIYIPEVNRFSASVEVSAQAKDSCHFKIKLPMFNVSSEKEFDSSIGQILDIITSVDLVLPITYKTLRWQNAKGNYFYVIELVNRGKLITKHKADNRFDTEEGFKELRRKTGTVNHIGPDDYISGRGPIFTLKTKEKLSVGFHFPQLENIPGFKLKGEATVQELVSVKYMVEPGYEYVMFDAMSESPKRFEHYWSHKTNQ